jgi:hypothetical protein
MGSDPADELLSGEPAGCALRQCARSVGERDRLLEPGEPLGGRGPFEDLAEPPSLVGVEP